MNFVDKSGLSHPTHSLPPDWTGCGYNDPDHSYAGARIEYNGGKMDGFMKTPTADLYAIGYYPEVFGQFFPAFARHFTTCDLYFPSILGPTFPNRIFQLCGQTDRLDNSFFGLHPADNSRSLLTGRRYQPVLLRQYSVLSSLPN